MNFICPICGAETENLFPMSDGLLVCFVCMSGEGIDDEQFLSVDLGCDLDNQEQRDATD